MGAMLVALALWLAATAARFVLTRRQVVAQDPCELCQFATMLQHDALLWLGFWLLTFVATLGRLPAVLASAGLVALSSVVLIDLFTLDQFGMRLYLADVLKFGAAPRFAVDYLGQGDGWQWLLVAAIALGAVLAWTVMATRRGVSRAARVGSLLAAAASLAVYALPDYSAHALPWTYQNVFEANAPTGVDEPFSESYRQTLLAEGREPEPVCAAGEDARLDVILVAVESLSWYHSGLLLERSMDVVPELDRLAREYAWWDAFHANGFTTDHGLIAMLAGQVPFPAVNRYRSLAAYAGYEDSGRAGVSARLARDGYFTAFFTSGDLAFLGKEDWLTSLGFDHIEGHDHPDYEGRERYGFAAVQDRYLYERVARWLQTERPRSPVFAFVETVSTHAPFLDPQTRRPDERQAFLAADAALAGFIENLRDVGYFDRGVVLITSDQRALTPIRREERRALGQAASARLPFVAVGRPFRGAGRMSTPAQMVDLPASLDRWLTDESCAAPARGDVFADRPPGCILHVDGNRRDVVNAFCGEDYAAIELDGDDTRVVEGRLPDSARWIETINRYRASLQALEPNLERVL